MALEVVYFISALLGFVFGRHILRPNPLLTLGFGAVLALGLGNYPFYPDGFVSLTFIVSLVGILVGGVFRR